MERVDVWKRFTRGSREGGAYTAAMAWEDGMARRRGRCVGQQVVREAGVMARDEFVCLRGSNKRD